MKIETEKDFELMQPFGPSVLRVKIPEEIIIKLKSAVGKIDWDLVMEMIEELEILQRKEEFGNDMINTWDE